MKKEIKIILETEGENERTFAQIQSKKITPNELVLGISALVTALISIIEPESKSEFYLKLFESIQETVDSGRTLIDDTKKNEEKAD